MQVENRNSDNGSFPLSLIPNDPWHEIELTNTQENPWTTGSLFVTQEPFLPLGQQMLKYTPPGQKARIKLAQAINLKVSVLKDTEVKRTQRHKRQSSQYYTRIERRVILSCTNCHSFPIHIELECLIGGKVTKVSSGGIVTDSGETLRSYHTPYDCSTKIKWTEAIAPGQSFKPVIEVAYYAPGG